ncbi:MAG: T9SS type A sorting domain-containing protein, partial [Chloroflexia bacterium]|nr:T9SS type A sorting domain-containing protein [Chloroflexia bacterium]
GDYTSKTANIQKGTTTSLYFRAGYSGYSYLVYWSAWIDYDQDGIFETNEKIVSGSSSSPGYLVQYINVPATALSGPTRLRISMKYGSQATACETFQYGEVEDYTVNISNYGFAGYSANNPSAVKLGNEIQSPELEVYPNPAADKVKLRFARGIESQIEIINATGKTMLIKTPKSNDFEINITSFPAGLYYVRYNNGLEMMVSKFIKR